MLPAAEPAFPPCPPVSSSAFYASPSPALDSAAVDVVVGHSHLISSRQIVRAGRIRGERKRAAEATLVSSPAFNLHSSSPPRSAVCSLSFSLSGYFEYIFGNEPRTDLRSSECCGCGRAPCGGRPHRRHLSLLRSSLVFNPPIDAHSLASLPSLAADGRKDVHLGYPHIKWAGGQCNQGQSKKACMINKYHKLPNWTGVCWSINYKILQTL